MKIRRPALLVVGIIMVVLQIMSIAGGERFDTNFWHNPGYMQGNIIYDIISTLSFFLIGIVGVVLIVVSFVGKGRRNKDE